MRVTVLIENTSDGKMLCEHGLSLFIEEGGRRILLDSGSTEAFYENAKALGIDLTHLDACVLSHGHYDHSGGFEALFRNNREIKVYARYEALQPYLSGSGGMHEIGIPQNVLAYPERFALVDGCAELFEGVYLVPHATEGLEEIGAKSKLYKKPGDGILPDDFCHEQSLVFDTAKGLVIFNSCSHGGAGNIIREAREACGGKNVYAYVGGLHMKGKRGGEEICRFSEEEVDELCGVFRRENVAQIYTGHCTGACGLAKLKERLGDRIHPLTTGLVFEL